MQSPDRDGNSSISTLYKPSPLLSDESYGSDRSDESLTTSFKPLEISYQFQFQREEIEKVLMSLQLSRIQRDQIISTVLTLMNHVETEYTQLSGDKKKCLVFDSLFHLAQQNGVHPVEFDTLLLSSTIDLIAQIGKKPSEVNKTSRHDAETQTSPRESSTCWSCL